MSSLKKWLGFPGSSSRKNKTSDGGNEGPSETLTNSSDERNMSNTSQYFGQNIDGKSDCAKEEVSSRSVSENIGVDLECSNGEGKIAEVKPFYGDQFPLRATNVSNDLPFGDGSSHVFGYENFGNTCYCNSVLQCLYNMDEFRVNILKHPKRDGPIRARKDTMMGSKPRFFTESSFAGTSHSNANSNSGGGIAGNLSSSAPEGPVSSADNSRKNSLKFFKNPTEGTIPNQNNNKSKSSVSASTESMSAASSVHSLASQNKNVRPVHAAVMPSDPISEKLHGHYNRFLVGRTQSSPFGSYSQESGKTRSDGSPDTHNLTVPSQNITPFQGTSPSIEQRKKAALIRGPIINLDISVADYLPKGGKPTLYSGLKDIFECICENDSPLGIVSPSNFVDILRRENILFSSSMHQDAHEFLNYLLNELSDIIKRDSITGDEHSENTFIEDLFMGTTLNSTRCFTCDNVTTRDERFLDFPVEIQQDEEINIQDILKNYHHREMLSGANKFFCDKCCGLQEAERTVGFKTLPKALAIHLKRFKYSEIRNCNAKLFNKIHYPLNLTVCSSFDDRVCRDYELNAIVIHMGAGPHHGHYVSICKNPKYGWLLFDDETVESISEETVLNFVGDPRELTTAYVLFYREKSSAILKQEEIEENINELIKRDEFIGRHSIVSVHENAAPLEDVPEEATNNETKQLRRKSRIFNFKRSTKS